MKYRIIQCNISEVRLLDFVHLGPAGWAQVVAINNAIMRYTLRTTKGIVPYGGLDVLLVARPIMPELPRPERAEVERPRYFLEDGR